jgi:hypothetical protein
MSIYTPAVSAEAARVDQLVEGVASIPLSRPLHRRIERSFEAALRRGRTAQASLRGVIRGTTRSALAAGRPREEVSAVLLTFLAHHPTRDRIDHVSLVTGRRASEHVLDQVRRWIDEA